MSIVEFSGLICVSLLANLRKMNTISVPAVEAGAYNSTYTVNQQPNKIKPRIICGACGAEEVEVDDNKTECPNCDEYIY